MTAKQESRRKEAPEQKIDPAIDALLDFLAACAVLRDSYGKANPEPTDP